MGTPTQPSLFIFGSAPFEMTVKEFAQCERVTERTVYTWIAKGAVEHRRTPGGGIRIPAALMKSAEEVGSPSR